jgi:uncharacterized protein YbjT (DUF2867 family)
LRILLFGASGSAGGSVLRACLGDPGVHSVYAITRRPLPDTRGPAGKLQASTHGDYLDYSAVRDAFVSVDACFFCLGRSVAQVSGEEEYRRITHDFALAAARMLHQLSPAAVFHYISGQGTNPNSRLMWARVKAQTERELIDLFGAVCWRPAAIDGERSESAPWFFHVFLPFYKLLRPFRSLYIDGQDLGRAMLAATRTGVRGRIFENAEIRDIVERR